MRSPVEEERWEALFRRAEVGKPDPAFLDALERRLRAETATRAEAGREGSSRGGRPVLPRRTALALLGAAAVLLVAAALGLVPGSDDAPAPGAAAADPVVVAVRSDPGPMRRGRERDWCLMELIREADLVLAGRFLDGGEDSSFRIDRVLRGESEGGRISLVTRNGLVCPRPASPRAGAHAVVFAVVEDGEVKVPSRAWLYEFPSEAERSRLADRVAAYQTPSAAGTIARMIREERRGGLSREPLASFPKLVRDLGLSGGVSAAVALLDLQSEMGESDTRGLLVDALAGIDLSGPTRAEDDPTRRREVSRLRAVLARKTALDPRSSASARAGALEIAIRRSPEALSGEETASLVADAKLPYFVRRLAVRLAGGGRMREGVPALLDLVLSPPAGDGPAPKTGWRHAGITAGTLRFEAIDALGEIGDRRAVPVLEEVMRRDGSADTGLARKITRALEEIERKR